MGTLIGLRDGSVNCLVSGEMLSCRCEELRNFRATVAWNQFS